MQVRHFGISVILLLCIFIHSILCANLTEDQKLDIITRDWTYREEQLKKSLAGRGSSKRKSLPKGDVFKDLKIATLKCEGTFSIAKEGHIGFNLSPRKQPCQYTFLGSRKLQCTVAVLCKEKIVLQSCDKEWLVLSDGTDGLMTGCGSFSFSDAPRIPRNNGTDLYFYLQGSSPAQCIVFCAEEWKGRSGAKAAKKISKNTNFEGYKMETSCKCGIRKNYGRVVGGENAQKNEFPWIGAVVFKGQRSGRMPFCGGSLVSDRYFISAAHCFAIDGIEADEIQVVLHGHIMAKRHRGDPNDPEYKDIPGWDLPDETDESEGSIRMDVQEITNHPLFNDRTFDYDIAILKFTRAVNLRKGKVYPICIQYVSEVYSYTDGANMVVAGWGRPWETAPTGSRILQKLDVPYLNLKDCNKYTSPSMRHICAGYIEGGKDACSGDSGGPLAYQFNNGNNQYLLSGIVSAGAGCARKDNLGLYSDVQELIQWAYHHMPDAVYCPRD